MRNLGRHEPETAYFKVKLEHQGVGWDYPVGRKLFVDYQQISGMNAIKEKLMDGWTIFLLVLKGSDQIKVTKVKPAAPHDCWIKNTSD